MFSAIKIGILENQEAAVQFAHSKYLAVLINGTMAVAEYRYIFIA